MDQLPPDSHCARRSQTEPEGADGAAGALELDSFEESDELEVEELEAEDSDSDELEVESRSVLRLDLVEGPTPQGEPLSLSRRRGKPCGSRLDPVGAHHL